MSEDRLRIVHVVTSLLVGGMERFVLRIAAEQCRQGHAASILALRGGPLEDEAATEGLRTTVLAGGRVARLGCALRVYADWRPHVVHAHNPGAVAYTLPGRLFGARTVMTRHGQLADWRPSIAVRQGLDAVVAVSQAAHDTLGARLPEVGSRTSVILNGVHPPVPLRPRNDLRRELRLGEGPAALIVARLDALKGHGALLRALREAPGVTLVVAGDGPEAEGLTRLAAEAGVAERVRFLGYRRDVPDLLAACDLFVLPSHTEGMPLSVLEAMAAGLPVIATPVGGVPEALDGGLAGILVPVGDERALAAALRRLGDDAEERARLAEAGRRRVHRHFSFSAMTAQYEALYRRLLARPGHAAAVDARPDGAAGVEVR